MENALPARKPRQSCAESSLSCPSLSSAACCTSVVEGRAARSKSPAAGPQSAPAAQTPRSANPCCDCGCRRAQNTRPGGTTSSPYAVRLCICLPPLRDRPADRYRPAAGKSSRKGLGGRRLEGGIGLIETWPFTVTRPSSMRSRSPGMPTTRLTRNGGRGMVKDDDVAARHIAIRQQPPAQPCRPARRPAC
jgi:ubiquitin